MPGAVAPFAPSARHYCAAFDKTVENVLKSFERPIPEFCLLLKDIKPPPIK